jgi:hypothetical protein
MAGIDWARDDYMVCLRYPGGEPLELVTLRYGAPG